MITTKKEKANLHHGRYHDEQEEAEIKSATCVMFLIKWLCSSATSTSTAATAETQSDEGHEQCSDDDDDNNQDNQPVLLEDIIILMLFHIRSKLNVHFAHYKITWNGQRGRKLIKKILTDIAAIRFPTDSRSASQHHLSPEEMGKFEFPPFLFLFHE